MSTIEIGKSTYGRGAVAKTTYYELKSQKSDGKKLVLRIAPPIKSAKDNGRGWFVFSPTHFGYTTEVAGGNGKSYKKYHTFSCIQRKNRDGQITQECPECTSIESKKEKRDAMAVDLRAKGKTEEQIESMLGSHNQWIKDHNLSKKFKVLAKNQSGEWGIFQLGVRLFQALEAELERLSKEGEDATGAQNGIYLEFEVSGPNPMNLTWTVKANMIKDGKTLSYAYDSLGSQDFDQLSKLPELKDLNVSLREDDIRQLVNSAGDPDIIKAVFGLSQPVEKNEAPKPVYTQPAAIAILETQAKAAQPELSEIEALQAKLAALQASANTKTPATAPAAVVVASEESDEDFLAKFR